jgi:hypothetical protein
MCASSAFRSSCTTWRSPKRCCPGSPPMRGPGHTPGHLVYVLNGGERDVIFWQGALRRPRATSGAAPLRPRDALSAFVLVPRAQRRSSRRRCKADPGLRHCLLGHRAEPAVQSAFSPPPRKTSPLGLAAIRRPRRSAPRPSASATTSTRCCVMYADYDKLTHTSASRPISRRMRSSREISDDDEAQIAYAITLNTAASPNDKTYAQQLKGAAILEPIFKRQPQHPGVAHYLIHLYDYPAIAEKGLDAAKRYAKIAPAAPHAQHMPSHIFTRVGYWKESIDSNTRLGEGGEGGKESASSCTPGLHGLRLSAARAGQAGARRHRRDDCDHRQAHRSRRPLRAGGQPARAMRSSAATGAARRQLEVGRAGSPMSMAITHFARALGAARSGKPKPPRPTSPSSRSCATSCASQGRLLGRASTSSGRSRAPGCSTPRASTTRRSRR